MPKFEIETIFQRSAWATYRKYLFILEKKFWNVLLIPIFTLFLFIIIVFKLFEFFELSIIVFLLLIINIVVIVIVIVFLIFFDFLESLISHRCEYQRQFTSHYIFSVAYAVLARQHQNMRIGTPIGLFFIFKGRSFPASAIEETSGIVSC
jgi:hypothetical protein